MNNIKAPSPVLLFLGMKSVLFLYTYIFSSRGKLYNLITANLEKKKVFISNPNTEEHQIVISAKS